MPNYMRATSVCQKCGSEVYFWTNPDLARMLDGAPEAICHDCEPKSRWQRGVGGIDPTEEPPGRPLTPLRSSMAKRRN